MILQLIGGIFKNYIMETRTRIGGIIIQENKLLMLLGKGYPDLWTPGGKIEEDENDEECLKRELKEEIGVELIESKLFNEYHSESFYSPGKFIIERTYLVKIEGNIIPAMEIDSIVWLTKEDFDNKKYPMIPQNQKIIEDIIKEKIW